MPSPWRIGGRDSFEGCGSSRVHDLQVVPLVHDEEEQHLAHGQLAYERMRKRMSIQRVLRPCRSCSSQSGAGACERIRNVRQAGAGGDHHRSSHFEESERAVGWRERVPERSARSKDTLALVR